MRPESRFWKIWIDTGGTFTDCIAISPSGEQLHCKVLSTSAVRGRVAQVTSPNQFRAILPWKLPENFFKGFRCQLIEADTDAGEILEYDSRENCFTLAAAQLSEKDTDAVFELASTEPAPVLGTRIVTQTPPSGSLPPVEMRLATTRGTNALLQRKGARVTLFITRGYADLLEIGNQDRPELFDLNIKKRKPLYETVVEVDERLSADGSVFTPLKLDHITATLRTRRSKPSSQYPENTQTAAVALLHSYKNPIHEKKLAAFLSGKEFAHISTSAATAPSVKIVPRAETTVIDAYLAPVIRDYLTGVGRAIERGSLKIMTSAGGLMAAGEYKAKDSLLSGPAAGIVGAAQIGVAAGLDKIIMFDMGGTSTDVAMYDGGFQYDFEHRVGEAHIVAPALSIESVAAGGGSICSFERYVLQVGPDSAGASPGPACYGTGGPLTLTDINLLLGRLDRNHFEIPINVAAAEIERSKIQQRINNEAGQSLSEDQVLQGFLDIANERMADAIRKISVRKGIDPAEFTLIAFGGAGGQHACAVADLLLMSRVLIPQNASLLSAQGLKDALITRVSERQILQPLPQLKNQVAQIVSELCNLATAELSKEGLSAQQVRLQSAIINLRFAGQNSSLAIDFNDRHDLEKTFLEYYARMFGHVPPRRTIECESIRVICSSKQENVKTPKTTLIPKPASSSAVVRLFAEAWIEAPLFKRSELKPGHFARGPAMIFENHTATFVAANWQFNIDSHQNIVMTKMEKSE